MENATDALKMAFAVFVFIVALSVTFLLMTRIKNTADAVLDYSDKTNYYTWTDEKIDEGRTVGEDTVIATLYSQTKENVYIKIEDGLNTTLFTTTNTRQERTNYINNYLSTGRNIYREKITEIVTRGVYREAEDGTRITIQPGTTRTYITYTKI